MRTKIKNKKIRKAIEEIVLIPDFTAWRLYLPDASSGKISLMMQEDRNGQDCVDYAVGAHQRNCKGAGCLNLYPEAIKPQEGNIILYHVKHSRNGDKNRIVHAGICQEDGTIISKWGKGGPIFNHPVDYVPLGYGNYVTFRRILR